MKTENGIGPPERMRSRRRSAGAVMGGPDYPIHGIPVAWSGNARVPGHLQPSTAARQQEPFCTCDDRLLRRARLVETLGTRVVSPLELIQEIDEWRSS